jgi:plasmid stability protein
MPTVIVRHLSVETHVALKARAARSGKSVVAEIREILDDAVRTQPAVGWQIAAPESATESC